ncbi:glucose-1-phosphate thymidylyltransferase [Streptomyces mobaraensis]|uniref:Glucose-1-phosphate thymidylyltransferase n=1 Tax=Streptomyces mobaraensis TaxID=35621 RepID=A0A5N5W4F2_STRMB|nr:glucose-1-phosphate thymidylyltransferase [Streptomyces mobaraensis]KAB7839566.1 glucose-1-phosphate thymidylyltransferase [Streptomyces mobaraensis]
MKALVLSGGSGTRLRPFSHSMPKQLMPIANKPVLEYVLENIRATGVHDIGIVTGDRGDQIAAALQDGSRLGVRLTYLPQDAPRGLAHAVITARAFLAEDDFVMYLGDNMLPAGITDAAAGFRAARTAAQVLVHKVSDPRAFGVAETAPDGRVLRLVEKPREPRSDLALIGVYFFTPAVHDAIAAIRPSARGELEITDAIQELVTRGAPVRAVEYDGYWKDTGEVADVLDCNRAVLDGLRAARHPTASVDAASELTGPVDLGPGVRLVRSRVQGPAVIGAGTVLEDSQVAPYTSIGGGCALRRTYLGNSIVLDGATVTGMRGIEGSVIGRGATVSAADHGDRHHRLVIGDHAGVEVAA